MVPLLEGPFQSFGVSFVDIGFRYSLSCNFLWEINTSALLRWTYIVCYYRVHDKMALLAVPFAYCTVYFIVCLTLVCRYYYVKFCQRRENKEKLFKPISCVLCEIPEFLKASKSTMFFKVPFSRVSQIQIQRGFPNL